MPLGIDGRKAHPEEVADDIVREDDAREVGWVVVVMSKTVDVRGYKSVRIDGSGVWKILTVYGLIEGAAADCGRDAVVDRRRNACVESDCVVVERRPVARENLLV